MIIEVFLIGLGTATGLILLDSALYFFAKLKEREIINKYGKQWEKKFPIKAYIIEGDQYFIDWKKRN